MNEEASVAWSERREQEEEKEVSVTLTNKLSVRATALVCEKRTDWNLSICQQLNYTEYEDLVWKSNIHHHQHLLLVSSVVSVTRPIKPGQLYCSVITRTIPCQPDSL